MAYDFISIEMHFNWLFLARTHYEISSCTARNINYLLKRFVCTVFLLAIKTNCLLFIMFSVLIWCKIEMRIKLMCAKCTTSWHVNRNGSANAIEMGTRDLYRQMRPSPIDQPDLFAWLPVPHNGVFQVFFTPFAFSCLWIVCCFAATFSATTLTTIAKFSPPLLVDFGLHWEVCHLFGFRFRIGFTFVPDIQKEWNMKSGKLSVIYHMKSGKTHITYDNKQLSIARALFESKFYEFSPLPSFLSLPGNTLLSNSAPYQRKYWISANANRKQNQKLACTCEILYEVYAKWEQG